AVSECWSLSSSHLSIIHAALQSVPATMETCLSPMPSVWQQVCFWPLFHLNWPFHSSDSQDHSGCVPMAAARIVLSRCRLARVLARVGLGRRMSCCWMLASPRHWCPPPPCLASAALPLLLRPRTTCVSCTSDSVAQAPTTYTSASLPASAALSTQNPPAA